MTLRGVRSILYLGARILGNVQAVRRGHAPQRAQQPAAGRIAGRILGRLIGRIFRSAVFLPVILLPLASCDVASPTPPPAAKPPSPSDGQPKFDVPYVATEDAILYQMLTVAGVTADDVVYDLGSGDGRIVIAAAQRYGARGVGIDIDPQRIAESNANAEMAGVTDRVRFIQQDLFEADLSEASIVTLYLLPSINARLRPKLLSELKPGVRVVSHNYDMGDWKPEKVITIPAVHYSRDDHTIYFWTIPAR